MGNKLYGYNRLTGYGCMKDLAGNIYEGEFFNGYLVQGKIYDHFGMISRGIYDKNKLVSGYHLSRPIELLRRFYNTTNHPSYDDIFEQYIYIQVEPEMEQATRRKVRAYYDIEASMKCMEVEYINDKLVSVEIYANNENNALIEKGDVSKYIQRGVVLYNVVDPLSGKCMELYLKVTPDLANYLWQDGTNCIAHFYYDENTKHLAIKSEIDKNGKINGSCLYYDIDGNILFSGSVLLGAASRGLIYYEGDYMLTNIINGKPDGHAVLYEDDSLLPDKIFGRMNFVHGRPKAWAKFYENDPKKRLTLYYHNQSIKPLVVNDNESLCLNKSNVFKLWIASVVKDKDWLYNIALKDDSNMIKLGTIEEVLNYVTVFQKSLIKNKKKKNREQIYIKNLHNILNNHNNYSPPEFAQAVKKDIYNDFYKYCKIANECGFISNDYYQQLIKEL